MFPLTQRFVRVGQTPRFISTNRVEISFCPFAWVRCSIPEKVALKSLLFPFLYHSLLSSVEPKSVILSNGFCCEKTHDDLRGVCSREVRMVKLGQQCQPRHDRWLTSSRAICSLCIKCLGSGGGFQKGTSRDDFRLYG